MHMNIWIKAHLVSMLPMCHETTLNLNLYCTRQNCVCLCQGLNFNGADLSRLDLRYINFKMANLRGANLTHTNLSGANLERADLSMACLDVSCCLHRHTRAMLSLLEQMGNMCLFIPGSQPTGCEDAVHQRWGSFPEMLQFWGSGRNQSQPGGWSSQLCTSCR